MEQVVVCNRKLQSSVVWYAVSQLLEVSKLPNPPLAARIVRLVIDAGLQYESLYPCPCSGNVIQSSAKSLQRASKSLRVRSANDQPHTASKTKIMQ